MSEGLVLLFGLAFGVSLIVLIVMWEGRRVGTSDVKPRSASSYYAGYLLDRPGDISTTEIESLIEMAKSESTEE